MIGARGWRFHSWCPLHADQLHSLEVVATTYAQVFPPSHTTLAIYHQDQVTDSYEDSNDTGSTTPDCWLSCSVAWSSSSWAKCSHAHLYESAKGDSAYIYVHLNLNERQNTDEPIDLDWLRVLSEVLHEWIINLNRNGKEYSALNSFHPLLPDILGNSKWTQWGHNSWGNPPGFLPSPRCVRVHET